MIKKIKNVWNLFIHYRYFNIAEKLYEKDAALVYIMELHLRNLRRKKPLSRKVKKAADTFFTQLEHDKLNVDTWGYTD